MPLLSFMIEIGSFLIKNKVKELLFFSITKCLIDEVKRFYEEQKTFINVLYKDSGIMIVSISGCEYAESFLRVYNSANTLFPLHARCDADEKIFYKQLIEDINFVYINDGDICGFISYHKLTEYYEITSLYVQRDCQRMKVGHRLLLFVENQIRSGNYAVIKVLNNADWAFDFYQKHDYTYLQNNQALLKKWSLTEKPWETILFKRIE